MFELLVLSPVMQINKANLSGIVTENGVRLNVLMEKSVIPSFFLLLSGLKNVNHAAVWPESTVQGLF